MFFQIETTEDKDDLIVAAKQKKCFIDKDCPTGDVCLPPGPFMCRPPIENAEPSKEGIDKISMLPLLYA